MLMHTNTYKSYLLSNNLSIFIFLSLPKTGFHLSGIVWTYPPNGSSGPTSSSSAASSNYGNGTYGHASNSTNNNNANAFGGPALAVLPNVGGVVPGPAAVVAAAAAAAAAANNGNNNLIGNQQAVHQHPMRLSSAERDSSNNGANYPLDENKKYNVSVSFDR